MTASMRCSAKRWPGRAGRASAWVLAGGSVTLLVACGGGGGGDGFAPPPPSRQALSAAAVAPAAAQLPTSALAPQAPDDHGEPASVENLLPPAAETAEPRPVLR